jgi:hypothetical protein
MVAKLIIDKRALGVLNGDLQQLGMDFAKRGGMREPLTEIAHDVMSPSIKENFLASGRPKQWAESEPELSKYRSIEHPAQAGNPPLMVTNKMFNAAKAKARWTIKDNRVTYGNFPSRVWFAMVHDDAGSSRRAGILHHRPFALIQEEDVRQIKDILINWIERRVSQRIKLFY